MLERMINMFKSFYTFPGLGAEFVFLSIGLAALMGVIWLVIYRPSLLKKGWGWIILAIGAILTWSAIAFVQIPLQNWCQDLVELIFGGGVFFEHYIWAAIPMIMVTGFVQEIAKLVPVIFFWLKNKKQLEPRTGLIAGAISGAGFGVFEAVWVFNMSFAQGWTWNMVNVYGPEALLGFWERFFTIGLHIATGALSGYGLAKGMAWQFYLIAAGLHSLANYGIILAANGNLTSVQVEIYLACVAVASTVLALWMRKKANTQAEPMEASPVEEPPASPPENL